MTTGIFTQPAASVLEDVDEFYFGGVSPWFHGTRLSDDGRFVVVTLTDPDEDDGANETTKEYTLSAGRVKDAFLEAKRLGYHLCCENEIADEQLGYGCAQDLGIVLQTACYGRLVFA